MDDDYGDKCEKIRDIDAIRFCAMIDPSGKILVGGLKEGLTMKLGREALDGVLAEIAARVFSRKKHDGPLGRVKYSASRREDIVIMSFPILDRAVVVVAEPSINIDRIAWRIIEILGDQWHSFVGK